MSRPTIPDPAVRGFWGVPILWTRGVVAVIIGIGLMIMGPAGRGLVGRRHDR
jgi:hypothetical protein